MSATYVSGMDSEFHIDEDKKTVTISQSDLDQLNEYSTSLPTSPSVGRIYKVWNPIDRDWFIRIVKDDPETVNPGSRIHVGYIYQLADKHPETLIDPNGTHASHCCPVHGCQYGYTGTECPIQTGARLPEYPANNGCELCEHDAETTNRAERVLDLLRNRSSAMLNVVRWAEARIDREDAKS